MPSENWIKSPDHDFVHRPVTLPLTGRPSRVFRRRHGTTLVKPARHSRVVHYRSHRLTDKLLKDQIQPASSSTSKQAFHYYHSVSTPIWAGEALPTNNSPPTPPQEEYRNGTSRTASKTS
ncbi:hypothetical protein E4U14_001603 [Claviceps sp. LM454 group G7]|nr:hypothetical protein E4U14_001603 [Claviceps sp. LM454 group G7]